MRRLGLPLAALAALVLAACGGGSGPSKEDWQKDYAPMNEQIKALGQTVGDAVTAAVGNPNGQEPDALATQFQGLADEATAAADQLAEIPTPDDKSIQENQDALVTALKQGANDLHAIAAAATANDAKAAAASAARLVADSADIRKPRQALEQQLAATS